MRRAIPFVALLSLSAHTDAEETYPTRQFGWWEVYGWDKDCWMKATYDGGTQIIFSWDFDSPKMFVMVRNAKWASIVEGRTYRIRLVIDGWGVYGDATGSNKTGTTNPGVSLFIDDSQEDLFLARLYSGRSLDLYVADRSAGSYSLKDSGAAVRELVNCARAIDPGGDEDPFSLSI
jgi:hypothetical protein